MRIPKYLSPSSIKTYTEDPEEFYFRYLCDVRTPRFPQTEPMAAGSAFDAYVKSYLYNSLFGAGHDVRYELGTIFEEQVELHNRTWAWEAGKHIFDEYKEAGCLADLMTELSQAVGKPRFEFTVQDDIDDIPLLGKPDVFFINNQGARVVYDWKVNGYCSPRTKSPMKGFVKLRTKVNGNYYPSIHKACTLKVVNGIAINTAMCLEDGDKGWADQLSIYAWLLGETIGSEEIIFGIDQIVGPKDKLRFATHRLRISPDYQYQLFELIKQIWSVIDSGWIFQDMTREQSDSRCELLEKRAEAMAGGESNYEAKEIGGLEELDGNSFSRMIK